MITVGIIDRDERARQETQRILNEENEVGANRIKVLFDIGSGRVDRTMLAPDVLIVDIENQEQLIVEHAKNAFPKTEIIILTEVADVRTVRNCFRYGAVSYLLKKTCLQSLASAINITMNDGSFVSPSINRALIEQSFKSKKYEDLLTARELQIANGIIEGLSYKMIAQKYTISLDTVRIYIKRIYRKLQINSKGELIAQLTA
ncbi:response regulator transcription factor [Sphingobacterium sp. BIGb0165]|uniref:LuxR C-terminal-related transcriptional regulator n=1 Tax=Sphingobacterium sp. BIGb0165 TaxID=2940615 RepID=UPI0021684D0A|nr:response regulator transcription factor [Sphingobacterium sp. BIGb0165]MCS4227995.1 DNA-binding NarL/FixJ family response regulator [Sphingobacterium sp. BIGb0165]